MRKKQGGTHVGFVLSFVIFITFLIFLYSILIEPTKANQNKESLLENFKINLIENTSLKLRISSIAITDDSPQNCVRLEGLVPDLNLSSRIIVKNELNQIQESYVLGNDLEIVRSNSNDDFFKIYYSEEFEELSSIGGSNCVTKTYKKGLVKVNEYVFEPNVINLISIYGNDYENLKVRLGIPSDSDFGFGFTYNNDTMITAEKEVTTNVYVEDVQVQYFDKNANVLLGILNIRIW